MTEPSIFSQIIEKKIPATIRYEDNDFIVIDDIHPRAPIHVLIIPKQPHTSLEAIALDDASFHSKLLILARKVAKQLGIQENYKLFMNVGTQVQAIHHLHLHLLGGYKAKEGLGGFSESA